MSKSPIFQFLTKKENLPAVLEVVRYAEEIREYLADGFWIKLQDAIKKHPKALSTSFSWKHELSDKADGYFSLFARPPAVSEKAQALGYGIEAAQEYFGMGLRWNKKADVDTLCQLQPVKALQAELRKQQSGIGASIESEPDELWLWWEDWQRNPYTDPWSWFWHKRDDASFHSLAGKFWEFVLPIHGLILEANKALSRRRS